MSFGGGLLMTVEISNLHFQYRQNDFVLSVDNCNFQNRINLIAGNNGAGKTTLLKLIYDLLKLQNKNSITFNRKIKNNEWKSRVSAYLGPEYLIPYMTPFNYLNLFANSYNLDVNNSPIIEKISNFLGDLYVTKKTISDLSLGNKQKVGISACLLLNCELIIFDEPYANLDIKSRSELNSIIREYNELFKSCNFLISTHDIHNIEEIIDTVYIMKNGHIDNIGNSINVNTIEEILST